MKKFDSNLPAVQETYRVAAQPLPTIDADYEPQPAHLPLAHYLWILRRHGWKIGAFIVGVFPAAHATRFCAAPSRDCRGNGAARS